MTFRLLMCLLGLVALGCGDSASDSTLTVFAAASTTDAIQEIGDAFEAANPGTNVEFNLAGSAALREQILEGADPDLIMTANLATMEELVASGFVSNFEVVAENQLVLVAPPDNPGNVETLQDLENSELLIGLCDAQVPCGELARDVLTENLVQVFPDTNEGDVRSLLGKVTSGELDAALVYATDAHAAGDQVKMFTIGEHRYNQYPIATLTTAGNTVLANSFIAFVASDDGKNILTKYGFVCG